VRRLSLNTVCQEARCPNIYECWSEGTATFMILGEICTRACGYCAVKSGRPLPPDPDEPEHVAEAVAAMGLEHAVITSVDRDDLPDGGAAHFARTIRAVRQRSPGTRVEVLIPDFLESLDLVLEAGPDVLNHNTETVPRLYRRARSRGDYARTLEVLRRAHEYRQGRAMLTKSGLMVGLGETRDELVRVFADLRSVGCDILTVGQYLRPTLKHLPVERYWSPDEFADLRRQALALGFRFVEAGPLVRSSYHAQRHRQGAEST
jgi:lipoic acid synthetase